MVGLIVLKTKQMGIAKSEQALIELYVCRNNFVFGRIDAVTQLHVLLIGVHDKIMW